VFHRGSHVQILAGADTGKTEVMRQCITELLAKGVPPEGIVGAGMQTGLYVDYP
jgi:DNA helicase-2/ATP-dependent DNA helicase PcrA